MDDFHFMRVHCDKHGKKPWRIHEFGTTADGGWFPIEAASEARRIEQRRRAAETAEMPAAKPQSGGDVGFEDWLARAGPAGDRVSPVTHLRDGRPTEGSGILEDMQDAFGESELQRAIRGLPPRHPVERWSTWDLTCPRCRRAKRHMTYRRREDRLYATFTELAERGTTVVTPEFLQKYETHRDGESLG